MKKKKKKIAKEKGDIAIWFVIAVETRHVNLSLLIHIGSFFCFFKLFLWHDNSAFLDMVHPNVFVQLCSAYMSIKLNDWQSFFELGLVSSDTNNITKFLKFLI